MAAAQCKPISQQPRQHVKKLKGGNEQHGGSLYGCCCVCWIGSGACAAAEGGLLFRATACCTMTATEHAMEAATVPSCCCASCYAVLPAACDAVNCNGGTCRMRGQLNLAVFPQYHAAPHVTCMQCNPSCKSPGLHGSQLPANDFTRERLNRQLRRHHHRHRRRRESLK